MNERGSITFWILGLSIAVLFLGGMSVDLWRVMSDRRELAAVADSAAAAAASAVDADHWRESGEVALVDAHANALAAEVVAEHDVSDELSAPIGVTVVDDAVEVSLVRTVDLTFLRIFMVGEEPFVIRVVSTARAAPSP